MEGGTQGILRPTGSGPFGVELAGMALAPGPGAWGWGGRPLLTRWAHSPSAARGPAGSQAGLSHWLSGHPLPRQAAGSLCLSCCPGGGLARVGARSWPGPHLQSGALVFLSCSWARAPQMSGVARLLPCPSSLHGRVQPGLAPSPLGGGGGLRQSSGPSPTAGQTQPGHEHSALPGDPAPGPSLGGASPQAPGPSQRPTSLTEQAARLGC